MTSIVSAMPQFLAALATDAVVDPTGALVALGVLAAVGVLAFLLVRNRPKPRAPIADEERTTPAAQVATDTDAKAAAKALRRAARGGVKVGADGKARRVDAFEIAEEEEEAEVVQPAPGKPSDAEQRAYLETGLAKTRSEGFIARLGKLFAGKQLDANLLNEVEEVLFRADLGVKTAESLLQALKSASSRKELMDTQHVWAVLRQKALNLLKSVDNGSLKLTAATGPAVLMVVGVNGSGKTTTIGKLAHRYAGQGRKVLVAAGDTFRAAAVDQLEVWCNRAGVPLFRGKEGADPASVCFGAIERAKAEGFDLVIVDTAGRLHTNQGLMEELAKIGRVANKAQDGAPHEVLLVLDATMGQNAVKQAELFRKSVAVTGIALTKLDGTARGGVVLAIAETLGLPVKLVGVGEKMHDLRDFDADLFIETLFAQE